MARSDRMAEYFTHVASGLYAVPPGTQPGEYWAQRLLEARPRASGAQGASPSTSRETA